MKGKKKYSQHNKSGEEGVEGARQRSKAEVQVTPLENRRVNTNFSNCVGGLDQKVKKGEKNKQGQSRMDTFLIAPDENLSESRERAERSPPEKNDELHREKGSKGQEASPQNTTEELFRQIMIKIDENGGELMKEVRKLMEEERRVRLEMEKELEIWMLRVRELEARIARMENGERMKNIIIKGIPEEENENQKITEGAVKRILKDQMKIKEVRADNISRIGRKIDGRNRPILVRCADIEEKKRILAERTKLKGTRIFLEDDLPYWMREKRWKLLELARRMEIPNKEINWRDLKIVIRGKMYELSVKDEEECLLEIRNPDLKD